MDIGEEMSPIQFVGFLPKFPRVRFIWEKRLLGSWMNWSHRECPSAEVC